MSPEEPETTRRRRPTALDPVASVRDHPRWFFRTGRFEWQTAVGLLVAEALQSPLVGTTEVHRVDDWIAVSADGDWLGGDLEAFTKPTPYPEGGTNATRVEVVLTAFCEAVFTASRGQRSDIRALGENSMPASMSDALRDPERGRVVVFRLPPAEHPERQAALPRTTGQMAIRLADLPEREGRFQDA